MGDYTKLSEDALVETIQKLDAEMGALRAEKAEASRALSAAIHARQAGDRWREMSQEERVALKRIATGA